MKSKLNGIIAAIALLFSTKAMASVPGQNDMENYLYQPTPEKFERDIAELEFRGVIENQNGQFVIKDESALEQLRQEGRVDLIFAANGVVCY